VPCPDEANASLPGSFLASAISSGTVRTGTLLFTTSRFGNVPVIDTGAKSLMGSNGSFA
jgi:hypothetical protein